MKRYPRYKDSKVKWLGNVPEHWKMKRLALAFAENKNKNSDYSFHSAFKFNYGTLVPKNEVGNLDELRETYTGYTVLAPEDIVINCLNLNYDFVSQRVAQSSQAGIITSAYLTITPRSGFNSNYYTYLFKALDSQKIFHGMGTGIRLTLSYSDLKKMSITIPPEPEQRAIVAFLDRAVEKIDGYIAAKEAEIEKLGTLKQSVIAKAVTQGLNPDAPMKDSGIPWLGNVPEHWGMKRLALQFLEVKENNAKYQYHYAFKFNYGTIVPKAEYGNVDDLRETYEKYTVVHAKDIVINGLNLNYDFISLRVAKVPESGIITSAYLSIRPRVGVNADYYTHFLKSIDSKKVFHGMGTGIRLTLSFGELKKMLIPIPPADEQQAIVDYISRKTREIDGFITGIRAQIEKLKVYKQRLISDVVTGKICVCEDFLEAN